MTLTIGQVLENRYRIDALLGQGGMGAVYRATDLRFNALAAVKENLDVTPQAQQQFASEAGILHSLRHASLPRVTDYFCLAGFGQSGHHQVQLRRRAEAWHDAGGCLQPRRRQPVRLRRHGRQRVRVVCRLVPGGLQCPVAHP